MMGNSTLSELRDIFLTQLHLVSAELVEDTVAADLVARPAPLLPFLNNHTAGPHHIILCHLELNIIENIFYDLLGIIDYNVKGLINQGEGSGLLESELISEHDIGISLIFWMIKKFFLSICSCVCVLVFQ